MVGPTKLSWRLMHLLPDIASHKTSKSDAGQKDDPPGDDTSQKRNSRLIGMGTDKRFSAKPFRFLVVL
jgi:hypothetical protein